MSHDCRAGEHHGLLLVNYGIMRLSGRIAALLARFNVLGALIRITGLVVMTMGTQMALDGVAAWWLATST